MFDKDYQWDEAIVDRAGICLVARSWARFCPANTKFLFAKDPARCLSRLRIWVGIGIGTLASIIINLMALAIMHLSWPLAGAAFLILAIGGGMAHAILGMGTSRQDEACRILGALFPGEQGETVEKMRAAGYADRVWALEILSQVGGERNRARIASRLLDQDTSQPAQTSTPGRIGRL